MEEARVVRADIRHLEQNLGLPGRGSLNLVTVLVGLFVYGRHALSL